VQTRIFVQTNDPFLNLAVTSTTCKIHSFQTHTPASLMLTEIYLSSTTLTDQVTFIGLSGTITTLPPGPLPRLDISTAVQLPSR
jgi:hypothetical protein